MRITEIAPPGREKQVKALKKKFDDKGAPYAIAWAQHNKHGKPKKNEGKMSDIDIDIKTMSDTEFEKKYGKSKAQLQKDLKEAFNSERDEVKAILDKYGIKNADDVELGSDVYDELFGYYMDSGEMPYGVMKARTGMPDEWIADRLDDLGLVEQDVPTQKGRDAKPDVLTPRAMNVVKKQIKKDANKQRRADSKKAVDTDESTNQVAGIGHQGLNFKFKVSDLINHAKQYPVKQIDPNVFKAQLAGRQEDPTKSGQRAANADLSYPIIVVKFNDGSLMIADGTHRVQKAISLQQKINARIIPVSDMQKFRVASLSDNPTQSTQQKDKKSKVDTSAGAADSTPTIAQAFRKGYGSESVEEAPFGAVKKAMNTAKRMVGKVPGLASVGDRAQGEKDIGDRANALWKAFTKFKATDPDSQQQQAWFQKAGLDVVADGPNDNIDQNDVLQAIKTAKGAEDSGVAKTDTTQSDEMDKATLVQLQKIAPNADAKTMRAVNTMAQGQTISGDLQKSLRPVIQKIAVALQNPTQRQRLSKSLGESLSQTDLSKLDMLARQGMVPKNKVARFKTAMRTLAKGKDLPISYKDDVIDVVMKLSKIITKPSVMGMIRKGLRENQNPKSTFDKWVKKAKDKHNI